ncbi:hypothetical protein QCA50_008282 [Cerrena zonata]|uniref:Uncharacterized protein n=1 Tax=Cerrena zonata TaxID=2478898 RepID=A0AAW0GF58_9APHY
MFSATDILATLKCASHTGTFRCSIRYCRTSREIGLERLTRTFIYLICVYVYHGTMQLLRLIVSILDSNFMSPRDSFSKASISVGQRHFWDPYTYSQAIHIVKDSLQTHPTLYFLLVTTPIIKSIFICRWETMYLP